MFLFFPLRRRIKLLLAFLLLIHGALWWFVWKFSASSALLFLHYRVQGGADLIGFRNTLFVLPLIGLVVMAVNLFLASLLRRRDKVLAGLCIMVAILVQALLLLALAALFIVNRT